MNIEGAEAVITVAADLGFVGSEQNERDMTNYKGHRDLADRPDLEGSAGDNVDAADVVVVGSGAAAHSAAIMAARGYAGSMVLAHDANCFIDYFGAAHDAARAAAAPNWHYEHITDDVLPALLASDVTQEQIEEMMVENPVRYFTPAKGGAL